MGDDCKASDPGGSPVRRAPADPAAPLSRALLLALFALIAWSFVQHLRVRNPDPDLVSLYAEVAPLLRGQPTGFLSARPPREARYSHHALRYVLAPQPVRWEDPTRPESEWILSDLGGDLRGYQVARHLDRERKLLRRR